VLGLALRHVLEIDASLRPDPGALGFDRTVWSYPGALFLSAGGYHHHLGVNTWAGRAAPAAETEARLLEWRISLPGSDAVQRVVDRLRAAEFDAVEQPDGWLTRDPWGTPLRLVGH
jgi:catechol 2,3-dioxygenase